MVRYFTTQRKILMEFLESHPEQKFSAKEIANNLNSDLISLSAVYRNLLSLEKEGKIISFINEGSREKFYRCIMSEECKNSIHLTCIKCGHTFHMDNKSADLLKNTVLSSDKFNINFSKTVIYGTCDDCKQGDKIDKT